MQEISSWTFYSADSLVRHLSGVTRIGIGAAERITEEVGLREEGLQLQFHTHTQLTGPVVEGLGLEDEPGSELTWSVTSGRGPNGSVHYRLVLHKIRDVEGRHI